MYSPTVFGYFKSVMIKLHYVTQVANCNLFKMLWEPYPKQPNLVYERPLPLNPLFLHYGDYHIYMLSL